MSVRPDKAARLRIEKWFWIANVPVIVVLYFYAPHVWNSISVLYLVLLSQWTQVRNLDGAEEAAKAAEGGDMATKKVASKTSAKVGQNNRVTQKTVKGKANPTSAQRKASMRKTPGKG